MAGVPGISEEQRKAALRADMKPGDYLMKDGRGQWTIMRPARRDVDQSVLNSVGQFADKYLGFGDDRRRSRLISGVASQWYGLDEGGNPAFGETPGIVYETKALGALPTTLGRAGMDWFFRSLGEKIGAGDLTQDPVYQMVQKALLSDPKWAVEAAERADAIHKAVREDMRLKAPQGFAENAQESLGVMLGQLPIPGKLVAKGAEAAAAAPSVMRRVAQGAEWFTPTVRPSVGNYATGTGVGATLGTLADGGEEEEVPTILPGPEQKGMYHVWPVYSDGSVGFSGHPDDEAALKLLLAEQAEREGDTQVKDYCSGGMATVKSMRAKYAEGGKVGNALKAIKDAIAHLDNNDTASAVRTLQTSPDALRDPGIAEALRKLRHPSSAKQGRKALDSAVVADTERAKLSTFKEGGKVTKSADEVTARAKKLLRG
jgi:hypothetical protein